MKLDTFPLLLIKQGNCAIGHFLRRIVFGSMNANFLMFIKHHLQYDILNIQNVLQLYINEIRSKYNLRI